MTPRLRLLPAVARCLEGEPPSPLRVRLLSLGAGSIRPAGCRVGFEQAGLELLPEPEAFTFNIEGDRMQAVEDGAGDHGIAEHLAPNPETLIAGDDDDRTA